MIKRTILLTALAMAFFSCSRGGSNNSTGDAGSAPSPSVSAQGLLADPYANFLILEPELGAVPDLSASARENFRKRDEILKKTASSEQVTLSAEERSLLERYPETVRGVWDILGQGASWYDGGGPYAVTASSSLPGQGKTTYNAANIHDHNLETVWSEGVKGLGIGEYLLFKFRNASPRVNTILIYNGISLNAKLWRYNARVKELKLFVNGEPFAVLKLKDTMALQKFTVEPLGRRGDGKDLEMKFVIMSVYPGEKFEDTVITELYFSGLDMY